MNLSSDKQHRAQEDVVNRDLEPATPSDPSAPPPAKASDPPTPVAPFVKPFDPPPKSWSIIARKWAFAVAAFFILGVAIVAAWRELPVGKEILNTADDFENYLDTLLLKNHRDYEIWYQANLFAQFFLILTSIGATILAAITTERNAPTVKWWSVFLTAVTAFSAAVLTTFHVRDNLEAFMDVNARVSNLQADYLSKRAKLFEDMKAKGWDANIEVPKLLKARKERERATKEGRGEDPELPISFGLPHEWLKLQSEMTTEASTIQTVRMRSWTNVGPQAAPQRTPPSPRE